MTELDSFLNTLNEIECKDPAACKLSREHESFYNEKEINTYCITRYKFPVPLNQDFLLFGLKKPNYSNMLSKINGKGEIFNLAELCDKSSANKLKHIFEGKISKVKKLQ
jgi:hypothetical protein